MAKIREAWRFRVKGNFGGSFLKVAGDKLAVSFQDAEHWTRLAGVSVDGVGLWDQRWEDFN